MSRDIALIRVCPVVGAASELLAEVTCRCASFHWPMKRDFCSGTDHRKDEGLYICSAFPVSLSVALPRCNKKRSVRSGTWLDQAHLKLHQTLPVTRLFVRQRLQSRAVLDASGA